MKSALRPDFYFKQMPTIRDADIAAEKKGASEEERAIFAMSQTKGWNIIKEYLVSLYNDLESVNKTAIANGAQLEEIGRNTVVISLTQDILDKVINKVADATEACTQDEQ